MKPVDSVKRFWSIRPGKERIAFCAAGAMTCVVVLYFFLLAPALDSSRQLSVELSGLRAQVDDMRQQQREILALRKKAATSSQRVDLQSLLKSSAARTSFAKSVERIDAVSGDRILLLAAPVPFDEWLGWIESLQREFGIRLVDCKIASTNEPGLVRAEATFAPRGQPAVRKAQ